MGSRDGPEGQELKSEGLGFECAPELYPNPNMVRLQFYEMYNNEIINIIYLQYKTDQNVTSHGAPPSQPQCCCHSLLSERPFSFAFPFLRHEGQLVDKGSEGEKYGEA